MTCGLGTLCQREREIKAKGVVLPGRALADQEPAHERERKRS